MVENGEDLGKKIRTGVAWSGLAQVGQQLASFLIAIVLTRLLSPDDYGLFGMVVAITGFAAVFVEVGFGTALIQKLDLERHHINAVFWFNIAVGGLITLILAAAAPYIASFYNEPSLQPIAVAISIIFLINSFAVVQFALLQKAMDFRTLAAVQLTAVVVSGTIATYLAFNGFGVWSLVAQVIASSIINVAVLWAIAPWRPDLSFRVDALRDLSKFSLNLVGFSISNYWFSNADNLLIGKYVGSESLGIYARGYSILLVPAVQISGIITNVMFPALSAIQKDIARVRKTYLSAISIISLATFPLTFGLLVVSRSFVLGLFGEKWAALIPILQVFCLVGAFRSVTTSVGWIYMSQGRTDIMFRFGLLADATFIISFVVGLQWGAFGVAVATAVASLLLWYPSWSIPARLIDLNFLTICKKLLPTFSVAATMAVAIWTLGLMFPSNWSYLIRLAVQVLFGITVYWGLLHLFKVDAYKTASSLVFKLLGKQSA